MTPSQTIAIAPYGHQMAIQTVLIEGNWPISCENFSYLLYMIVNMIVRFQNVAQTLDYLFMVVLSDLDFHMEFSLCQ